MFKNRIDIYLTHRLENCWTIDKAMASLSSCHLELVVWDGNHVKYCLKTGVVSEGIWDPLIGRHLRSKEDQRQGP